jgi:hypothetical protein
MLFRYHGLALNNKQKEAIGIVAIEWKSITLVMATFGRIIYVPPPPFLLPLCGYAHPLVSFLMPLDAYGHPKYIMTPSTPSLNEGEASLSLFLCGVE